MIVWQDMVNGGTYNDSVHDLAACTLSKIQASHQ